MIIVSCAELSTGRRARNAPAGALALIERHRKCVSSDTFGHFRTLFAPPARATNVKRVLFAAWFPIWSERKPLADRGLLAKSCAGDGARPPVSHGCLAGVPNIAQTAAEARFAMLLCEPARKSTGA